MIDVVWQLKKQRDCKSLL